MRTVFAAVLFLGLGTATAFSQVPPPPLNGKIDFTTVTGGKMSFSASGTYIVNTKDGWEVEFIKVEWQAANGYTEENYASVDEAKGTRTHSRILSPGNYTVRGCLYIRKPTGAFGGTDPREKYTTPSKTITVTP